MKNLPNNLWNSPVIRKRLQQEAGFECNWGIAEKKQVWAMVPFADSGTGVHVIRNYADHITNCDPHEMQQVFARKVMEELQRNCHFDGLWLVGYTHPPTTYDVITDSNNCWNRMICIWFDEDGDPQYTVESDRPFVQQAGLGEQYYIGLANQAHDQWKQMYGRKAMKSDMMLKENQTSKAALEALK